MKVSLSSWFVNIASGDEASSIGACGAGSTGEPRMIEESGTLEAGIVDAGILDAGIVDGILDAGIVEAGILDAGIKEMSRGWEPLDKELGGGGWGEDTMTDSGTLHDCSSGDC